MEIVNRGWEKGARVQRARVWAVERLVGFVNMGE